MCVIFEVVVCGCGFLGGGVCRCQKFDLTVVPTCTCRCNAHLSLTPALVHYMYTVCAAETADHV